MYLVNLYLFCQLTFQSRYVFVSSIPSWIHWHCNLWTITCTFMIGFNAKSHPIGGGQSFRANSIVNLKFPYKFSRKQQRDIYLQAHVSTPSIINLSIIYVFQFMFVVRRCHAILQKQLQPYKISLHSIMKIESSSSSTAMIPIGYPNVPRFARLVHKQHISISNI